MPRRLNSATAGELTWRRQLVNRLAGTSISPEGVVEEYFTERMMRPRRCDEGEKRFFASDRKRLTVKRISLKSMRWMGAMTLSAVFFSGK